MTELPVSDLEIASPSVVRQAARDFATALAATPQYAAFEEADRRLRSDMAAQRVMGSYQSKQTSLRMSLMLNAASPQERAELERLRQAFENDPAVSAYLKARAGLAALCKEATDQLSAHIELSFTAACRRGCC